MLTVALFLALAPYCLVVVGCAVLFWRAAKGSPRTAVSAVRRPLAAVVCTSEADAAACASSMRCVAASLRGGDTLTVVADHVGVESLALLRSVAGEIGARVIVNDGPKGKKYAQRAGVNAAADGSVVVCVDADCAVGGRFGESVRAAAEGIGGGLFMLLLPVEMSGGWSLFGRLVELEFGCLQVVTAGTALAARPTMANGAGMAFPKELYSGHDARTDYASG
ncbi:glycosyltransferase, partial [Salmonella enterica]|nr:glycosyltransferase [Salmonella enterica]